MPGPVILTDDLGNAWAVTVDTSSGIANLSITPSNDTPTPSGTNSITVTVLDIITAAMRELGVLASGEPASTDDTSWILTKLQRLIDRYNARKQMVYNVNFALYTTTANHSPHTIGPGGDFNTNQRPQSIESIAVLLATSAGTTVELVLGQQNQAWWAALPIKDLASTLPTDFYYSPDWPQGSIYLWPVPTASYQVRVQSRLVLSQVTSYSQQFTMPPGYWDLMVYDLAIGIAPSFERPVSADLRQARAEALKAVLVNNITSPRLASDSPSDGRTGNARPGFNFLTGQPW